MSLPAVNHFARLDLGPAQDSTAVTRLAREFNRGRTRYALRRLPSSPWG
jgi:hypothetical protein